MLSGQPGSPSAYEVSTQLTQQGHVANADWKALAERQFEPECLTLYLSNRCNLACTYCYATPDDETRAQMRVRTAQENRGNGTVNDFPILQKSEIEAAARLVGGHCAAKKIPITLVLHGGGEPTVHWDLVTWSWQVVARIANEYGIGFSSYIATNGVLPEDKVRWLSRHFDQIGLSCDGPPEVQDANRPTAAKTATSSIVQRTARILKDENATFAVRATITPELIERQTEIVEFVHDRMFADTVRFEPAYYGRRKLKLFRPDDADRFVTQFWEARRVARRLGCHLELSGVRIDEIHGPFCNPLRQVLQLTPDGTASACFLSVGNDHATDSSMAIGQLDGMAGGFYVDESRVSIQKRQAAGIPSRCTSCHNIFHCARDCPDVCLLRPTHEDQHREGFRCRVQKLLGRYLIMELALQSVTNPT
ncbi:MAG: radical SAM protein [Candidatus Hydrogenedentes bacterium]|nr:radical SAM protein [Candidatus Hydrogenedentota bacterium]